MLTIIRMMVMTMMMLLMMMIPMACGVSLATEAGTQLSALQLSRPLVKGIVHNFFIFGQI